MSVHPRFSLFVVLVVLGAACTSTPPAKPESKIDPNANIPSAKTFGWTPPTSTLVSTDVTQRKFDDNVRQAIVTQLERKGYTQAATDPDLVVAYDIGTYERTKTNPVGVGIGVGGWGGNVGGSVGVGTGGSSRTVTESRLTIRVSDRKRDAEVFLGTMTGDIAPGSSASDVSGVVAQALKDFPARRP